MIDSALLWIGITVIVGVVSLGYLVRTYASSHEFHYGGFAVVLVCSAGVLELGMANGYLPATLPLNLASGLSSVVALVTVIIVIWKGERIRMVPRNDS